MKLLFDKNLSPKLVELVATEFPESNHVERISRRGCADAWLWDYAKANGFVIASCTPKFESHNRRAGGICAIHKITRPTKSADCLLALFNPPKAHKKGRRGGALEKLDRV